MIPLTAEQIQKATGASALNAYLLGGAPFTDRKVAFLCSSRLEAACVGDRLSGVNARIDSLEGSAYANAKMFTRCLDCMKNYAIDSNWHKTPSVFTSLLLSGCPSAILRAIVSVGVYAVNRIVAFGSLPHISKEVFKRKISAVANLNASPAPVCKVFAVGVKASALHTKPSQILNRCTTSFFVAMLGNFCAPLIYKRTIGA